MTSAMNGEPQNSLQAGSSVQEAGRRIFYDGQSSRRHQVQLALRDQLEISENDAVIARWSFADIRRADSAAGILRLSCLSAPALARLELRDGALAAALIARCASLDDNVAGRHRATSIVGWSLAAAVSIVAMISFGLPVLADRLAPLVPEAFERRLGEATDVQIKAMFGNQVCHSAAGQAAYDKLLAALREAGGIETAVQSEVLSTPVPNAFALPGGRIYLFSGLLAKAENPDEIAGVLAHELGHVKHRDNVRGLIYNGGASFLVGLLFGDVTGSSALIFASRSLVTASYSREAEQGADDYSVAVMHKLGRPTKAMGQLLSRITAREGDKSLSILASHPLTEDRLQRMTAADRPPSGRPLLTNEEWKALKVICTTKG